MQAVTAEMAAAALQVQQVQASMLVQLNAAEEEYAELNASSGRQGRRSNVRKKKLEDLEFTIAALKRGEWPKDAKERVRKEKKAAIAEFAAKKQKQAIADRAAHHTAAPDLRSAAAATPAAAAAAGAAQAAAPA